VASGEEAMAGHKQVKPIEQVVEDLGRYPLEAFEFVREGLTYTVQRIHGTPSRSEQLVQQWMARKQVDLEQLADLYESEALPNHVRNLVEKLGGPAALNRHVTGRQLCEGLRELALQRWGLMASAVLRKWRITSTEDFGRIVFALVNAGHLQKRPEDTFEDFKNVFDFHSAFDARYKIPLPGSSQQKSPRRKQR